MTDPTASPPKYRGVNCASDNFGAANKTYGLAIFPCRDCPANMVTSKSLTPEYWSNTTAPDNTAQTGFTNSKACLTKPGYGYDGRGGTICPIGQYNPGGNVNNCQQVNSSIKEEVFLPDGCAIGIQSCRRRNRMSLKRTRYLHIYLHR